MFDKNKFAKILKKINETYDSQREFSKKSEINRTYLSQYMNMKLDEPPKPKTLEKLANASHSLITYEELMLICGYINSTNSIDTQDLLISLYEKLDNLEEQYIKKSKFLTYKESEISHDLFGQILNYLNDGHTTPETFEPEKILDGIDFVSNKSKQRICESLKEDFNYFYQKNLIKRKISDIKYKDYKANNLILKDKSSKSFNEKAFLLGNYMKKNKISHMFIVPILGKIAAGQPILAEEYIEGYLPVDPNIYGMTTPDDYFYLRISGNSMNLKVKNGDYALIHKQDYAENGDIIVAIVNGNDEATLKKYKKINDELIVLEPQSDDPNYEPIYIDKNTNFQIIGKAIGQFGKF